MTASILVCRHQQVADVASALAHHAEGLRSGCHVERGQDTVVEILHLAQLVTATDNVRVALARSDRAHQELVGARVV